MFRSDLEDVDALKIKSNQTIQSVIIHSSTMQINPDFVLNSTKPTKGFLCPVSANGYGIAFQSFSISNHETKANLFHTGTANADNSMEVEIDPSESEENMYRKIRYTFPEEVLKIPRMETSLTFRVGDNPLPNFRMIERHYFRDELIKSYDFNFGFVIPNSTNTWDAVYEIPSFPPPLIDAIVQNPYECKSDTFYFIGEELVMHHKVSYRYIATKDGKKQRCAPDADGKRGSCDGDGVQQAESKHCQDDDLIRAIGDAQITNDNKGGIQPGPEAKAGSTFAADSKGWAKDTEY